MWEKSKSTPIFETSENSFRIFLKISRTQNTFCEFSELPKISSTLKNGSLYFRNFQKFTEHTNKRNALKKNWFWAHASLLVCLCIIPLNSTAFLLTQMKRKVTIYHLLLCRIIIILISSKVIALTSLPCSMVMVQPKVPHDLKISWNLNLIQSSEPQVLAVTEADK